MAGFKPFLVLGLLKEIRTAVQDDRPLVVSGVLAEQLRKDLERGGSPGAVRVGGPVEHAAAVVLVLAGKATEDEEKVLRAANRARVPLVAVQTATERVDVPYVLATDVIPVPPGSGFPVEEIARVVAVRGGDQALSLAARLPLLRQAVCEELIERFSRRNGLLGAAIFMPGADFPVLTLNQLRLVLRIAAAHGVEIDQQRLPEVAATVGTGFALRTFVRRAARRLPFPQWAVKGAVAYSGTRAVGEAAVRYFAATAAAT
jgi:uncharacterized protein (DUF697 family)